MRYFLILLSLYVPASMAADKVNMGACFFRYEDNGILNVRPSYINVDGKKVAILEGGGIQCVPLTVGHHNVYAYSSDPYDPHDKNENTWRSKDLAIEVKTNMLTYVRVMPVSRDAAYVGPWNIWVTPKAPDMNAFPE